MVKILHSKPSCLTHFWPNHHTPLQRLTLLHTIFVPPKNNPTFNQKKKTIQHKTSTHYENKSEQGSSDEVEVCVLLTCSAFSSKYHHSNAPPRTLHLINFPSILCVMWCHGVVITCQSLTTMWSNSKHNTEWLIWNSTTIMLCNVFCCERMRQ